MAEAVLGAQQADAPTELLEEKQVRASGPENQLLSTGPGAAFRVVSEQPVGPPSRRWAPIIVSTVAALALVGCAAFGYLYSSERSAHADTRRELRFALVDLTRLQGDNNRIEGELAAAQDLSERRAGVLRRARSVLRGVDPLLTSVDELQSLTGDMQEARDAFAANSSELVDDLILLGNYLIDTSAYDLDYGYLSSLIDAINSEIATVRSDSWSLDGYDSQYGGATTRFDTRATGFVNSVRALERQLKLVTENE